VEDDYEEYVPRPQRRPRPVRRPVIVEVEEDAPVVRRRAPQRAAAARTPVARPPVQAARRPPPRLPPVLVPAASERRLVRNEVLVELKDGVAPDVVARRHGLTVLSTERFTLAGVTILRYRVEGNRSARQALAAMAGDARIAAAQPNFTYSLQHDMKPEEQQAAPVIATVPDGDILPVVIPLEPASAPESATVPAATAMPPAVPVAAAVERKPQYSLDKMGIDAAHRISRGNKVRIAVIDTAVDDLHPELEGVVTQRFDAIGDAVKGGNMHGTAIAGAIIAKSALQGVSPAAELLVARAFDGGTARPGSGAEGTTIHILKSLDWAHALGARVVNLSFAGPQDRLMSRALQGGSTKGMIAVAAAGNGGPRALPLYPGADPSVIAVTATDADDKVFAQANTGNYVAVAAPGVDVIAAEPGKRYGFSSGTSMAAAHVAGLVALMLEQKADLDLAGVRTILSETARDLGPKGRDSVFGAGHIDAPAALARTLKATN
jgi:subtilisin family serine protease